jgi:hypothetical protein
VVVDSDAIDFVAFSSNSHFAGVVSLLFVVMAVGFLECAAGLSPKVGGMDGVEGRVHADAAIIEINLPVKKNAKPKKAGDIAKLVLQREEFDPMFKVCSSCTGRLCR